jgi:hypothetical protein
MACSKSAVEGSFLLAVLRGGFNSRTLWASTLRAVPEAAVVVRQKAFRQTTSLPCVALASSPKDGLLDLTPFGVWASAVCMLGKCDFEVIVLVRLVRLGHYTDGTGEVARFVAIRDMPAEHFIGSSDLYSVIRPENFDAVQYSNFCNLADPTSPCIRQILRFQRGTDLPIGYFIYGFCWALVLWMEFLRSRRQFHLRGRFGDGSRLGLRSSWPFLGFELPAQPAFWRTKFSASRNS